MFKNLGYSSVTTRVLEIPEIIEQILSYLENDEKLRVAPVCKRWSDIALNLVWRRVDDIIHLLRGLAPMVPKERRYVSSFLRVISRLRLIGIFICRTSNVVSVLVTGRTFGSVLSVFDPLCMDPTNFPWRGIYAQLPSMRSPVIGLLSQSCPSCSLIFNNSHGFLRRIIEQNTF